MGGVLTDDNGRTSLDGLWACGETASTGAHGANRLASNSLLEAVVFGARVAADVAKRRPSASTMAPAAIESGTGEGAPEADEVSLLRRTMSAQVGVIRDRSGLVDALATIARLAKRARAPRFQNMLATAKLVTAAALARTESRGGHYRSDFPDADPGWQHRTLMTLADAERLAAPERVLIAAK
jgi:L-aspartate oxidase